MWNGHYWELDVMKASLAATEDVVERLLEEVELISKEIAWITQKQDGKTKVKGLQATQDAIYRRIGFLRQSKGRNACLEFSRTVKNPLAIRGNELDLHPWLLACPNGVIDLRTGKFRDGRPEEMITVACPTEWAGLDAPAYQWEKFLLSTQNDDENMVRYIQRLLGYGITGLNIEHILPVFHGPGRNGKGKIVEVLNHLLGLLAVSIPPELLLDQKRVRSSAGPSPDILDLKGLRLTFASETEEGQRFSAAKVKLLTGGDQLVGRYPHEKRPIRFTPTHTLILLTNHKPHAASDDFAFWERLHLVPFPISFVDRKPTAPNERQADKFIAEKMKSEAPGILAWLVRGCLEYQKRGLDPPGVVLEATEEYRKDEDLIAEFIEDCCMVGPHEKGQASEIFDQFARWFKDNISKKGNFSQRRFGKLLSKKFERSKSSGVVFYRGIDLDPDKLPSGEDKEKGLF
jgi:putative DNA primase/helicase